MQERISKTITEQERIRRAQLENEQRWKELARKAKLSHSAWAPVDDSLSLKQALTGCGKTQSF